MSNRLQEKIVKLRDELKRGSHITSNPVEARTYASITARLDEALREGQHTEALVFHTEPGDCPKWYDWCHCTDVYCHLCSKGGDASRAVYHLPPVCVEKATLEPMDDNYVSGLCWYVAWQLIAGPENYLGENGALDVPEELRPVRDLHVIKAAMREIIVANPGLKPKAAMGKFMKKFSNRADGAIAQKALDEIVTETQEKK